MKKTILSCAVLCAVAVIAAPKFIAPKVEQTTLDIVNKINDMPFYKAEIVSSSSDYLSSSTDIKLAFDFAKFAPGASNDVALDNMSIELRLDVNHAPILSSGASLMNFHIALKEPKLLQQQTQWQWDKSQPLYQVAGNYSVLGDLSYQDSSPKISYRGDDGTEFDVSAYQGKAETIDGSLTHQGLLPSVSLQSKVMSMSLANISMETRLEQSLSDYFSQDKVAQYYASIDIEQTDVKVPSKGMQLGLEHLAVAVNSALDDTKHLINSDVVYRAKSVKSDDFVAENLELALEINNIDEASYLQFNKLFSNPNFNPDPSLQMAQVMAFLESNLLDLVSPQPELNIVSAKGDFSYGHFAANFNTRLAKVDTLPDNLADMPFWLQHIEANSHIEVAKPLALSMAKLALRGRLSQSPQYKHASEQEVTQAVEEQAAGLIAMLESQGTLVAQGEDYIVDFEFKDRHAKLNGNQMALPLPQ